MLNSGEWMKKKLVYGIGINDADYITQKFESYIDYNGKKKQRRVWVCHFYEKWKDMLKRCYSDKYHEKQPTYKDCIVCEEWLTFSNFKEWMQDQFYQGKQLDKDLIEEGNKTYSPEKCLFLSRTVNAFMVSRKAVRGNYLLGVCWHKRDKKFISKCMNPFTNKLEYLGYFSNELSAHKAWKKRKLELAIELSSLPENKYLGDLLIKRYTFEEDEICNY